MSVFGGRANEAPVGEMSLNDVLNTPALRTELAAMTALCSDAMRRDLLAVFEPARRRHNVAATKIRENSLIDFQDPEETIQGDEVESERTEEFDLTSSRTQGLRRAAVTHFDKWQIDVLRRLGEVLSVRPDAVRKARADAKARGDAAAKAKRDKAYWDWANGMEDRSNDPADDTQEDEATALPEGFQAKILQFSKDRRTLILNSMLLLLLSLEHYTAHSRVLMLNLTKAFKLPESILIDNESKIANGLLTSAAANMSADKSRKRQASEDATARRWKVGLATVAGAALIGVTGGLAAPILAAGVGGIMGGLGLGAVASLLGPLATNMVLVGGLFGAYGGRMTGRIMEKYAQEIKDFKFIPTSSRNLEQASIDTFRPDDDAGLDQLQDPEKRGARKLRVAICISGSVTEAKDFVEPWTVFSGDRIEAFGLRWEMECLLQLGRKMLEVLQSFAWDFAKFQLLSMVLAGLWPFGLLRAAGTLDSPFAIAKTRSDRAGKVLADALINRVQGARPVTLVGYGLGARVIYSCLLQLAEQNVFGIVESAVLMGSPTPSETASWRRIRAVVSGRVVNVFSADDFMLGFLYRASSVQMGIAGVQKIQGVTGVENYDLTDMIKGHDRYRDLVGTILQRIGFADLDSWVVRQQQERLRKIESQDRIKKPATKTQEQQSEDNMLAKEDQSGQVVLVDNEKAVSMTQHPISPTIENRSRSSAPLQAQLREGPDAEEEEDDDYRIQMEDNDDSMLVLDPDPEPDFGPDQETVTFGSTARGFNVEWESEGR